MRYTVLTNFDNYTSSISCNNKGVITLTLTPNKIKEISTKTNIITKKRETWFDSKYCTLYKKKDNELLYKYTNYKPNNRIIESHKEKVVKTVIHKIPSEEVLLFPWTRREYLLRNYHYRKAERLRNKYYSYEHKYF